MNDIIGVMVFLWFLMFIMLQILLAELEREIVKNLNEIKKLLEKTSHKD